METVNENGENGVTEDEKKADTDNIVKEAMQHANAMETVNENGENGVTEDEKKADTDNVVKEASSPMEDKDAVAETKDLTKEDKQIEEKPLEAKSPETPADTP